MARRKKRWTIAELSKLDWDVVGRSSTTELASILRQARSQFKRREKAIIRSGEISGALEAYRDADTGQVDRILRNPSGKDRNQMLRELARYEAFFQAKTSTATGIRKVNREQDISIFGADANGRPKYEMSDEERKKFWSIYKEFEHQYRDRMTAYTSESVKQLLGEITIQNPYETDPSVWLNQLFIRAEAMLGNKVQFDEEGGYEIFSI